MAMRIGWQFVRPNGAVVVRGPFDGGHSFREGVANVRVHEKWGMIDREGRFVADAIYDMVWPSCQRRAAFKVENAWGYLDPNGDVAIEPRFIEVKNFMAKVPFTIARTQTGWGALRVDGSFVVPPEMEGIGVGADGWFRIVKGGLVGFCDDSGKQVIDCTFRGVDFFHDDRAVVNVDGKLGYIDRRGEIVIAAELDSASDFVDGIALVKKNGRVSFIGVDGRAAIATDYETATSFSGGLAFVWPTTEKNGHVIDTKGATVFECAFPNASPFDGNAARIGTADAGPFGLCDRAGNIVLPIEYAFVDPVMGGHRRIGKYIANKINYGYCDDTGKVTCAPKFTDARGFEEDLAIVQAEIEIVALAPVVGEVTRGEEAPRLRLTPKQITARTRFRPRPAMLDRVVAAGTDRAAIKRIFKEDPAQTTSLSFFLLDALGTGAVVALDLVVETARTLPHSATRWDCVAALDVIDSFDAACAQARLYGAVTEPERNLGRALRALARVDGELSERAAQSFAKIEADHPGSVRALLAKLDAEESTKPKALAINRGIDLAPAGDATPPQLQAVTKKKKMPEHWSAELFARPLLAGRTKALSLESVDELAVHLEAGDLDVVAIKSACDPESLRDFSWGVFSWWLAHQAPPKQKWAFTMLGDFGDDETVSRLAPMIAEWPGQSAHARAVAGLSVLGHIGSDAALRAVHKLSQRAKFGGLKKEAAGVIALIARQRGLTSEELADQLVPDFDLDDDGSKTLDFGARVFRVGFDEALKPFVIEDGKRIADLPKPTKNDDKARAAEALAFWKNLKKEVRAIASLHVERLENAMAARRRWHVDAFRAHFIEHPLLQHLARRLVWHAGDVAFRVAEDGTLAGTNDAVVALPTSAQIAIAHPIELGRDAVAAWSKIFGDYKIIQPFAQLEREIFVITEEEAAQRVVARFANVEVRGGALVSLLTHGWSRGPVEDGGIYEEISHPIASLRFQPGLAVGTSANPNQKLAPLVLKQSVIDPIVFSELMHTFERVKKTE